MVETLPNVDSKDTSEPIKAEINCDTASVVKKFRSAFGTSHRSGETGENGSGLTPAQEAALFKTKIKK